MDPEFWHQRWEKNELGFHQKDANPLMAAHFGVLGLKPGARMFVPLCGKTLDIAWLLTQGHAVAGCELSEIAVRDLFDGLGVKPTVTEEGALRRFSATSIDIFVGDFFDLTPQELGSIDAIYDRAALVALPAETRKRYAAHLGDITGTAPQFLITFDYDQSAMDGPPFSVPGDEVHALYDARYAVTELARVDVQGGLKGKCRADEIAWHLASR